MKGLIALDIDGTTAVPSHPISTEIIQFLTKLNHDKWQILFITGRTFHWAEMVLKVLPFSYNLAVQNGAITLEMPSRKILVKKYLNRTILPVMQEICQNEPTDFVIYSGYEHEDRCYYRPQNFSEELLRYLKARSLAFQERWQEISSFDSLGLIEFASVKCFGLHQPALALAKRIEQRLNLHVPVIRDPFNINYFVAQATEPSVTKGAAIKDLMKLWKINCPVIAAGDDHNDVSMFQEADVKVVMESAPFEVLSQADIIAPSAEKNGLIQGLSEAIRKLYP